MLWGEKILQCALNYKLYIISEFGLEAPLIGLDSCANYLLITSWSYFYFSILALYEVIGSWDGVILHVLPYQSS